MRCLPLFHVWVYSGQFVESIYSPLVGRKITVHAEIYKCRICGKSKTRKVKTW